MDTTGAKVRAAPWYSCYQHFKSQSTRQKKCNWLWQLPNNPSAMLFFSFFFTSQINIAKAVLPYCIVIAFGIKYPFNNKLRPVLGSCCQGPGGVPSQGLKASSEHAAAGRPVPLGPWGAWPGSLVLRAEHGEGFQLSLDQAGPPAQTHPCLGPIQPEGLPSQLEPGACGGASGWLGCGQPWLPSRAWSSWPGRAAGWSWLASEGGYCTALPWQPWPPPDALPPESELRHFQPLSRPCGAWGLSCAWPPPHPRKLCAMGAPRLPSCPGFQEELCGWWCELQAGPEPWWGAGRYPQAPDMHAWQDSSPNYEHLRKFGLSQVFHELKYLGSTNPMYLAKAKSEPVAGSEAYTL